MASMWRSMSSTFCLAPMAPSFASTGPAHPIYAVFEHRAIKVGPRSTRVGAVNIPVPGYRRQPVTVATREQREPADHPLATLVVAVKQIDHDTLPRRDALPD